MDLRINKPEGWDGRVAIILAHGAGQGIDSPFMKFFHEEVARRGFLTAMFNFEYMERKRKAPDPQPKLQARYREVIETVVDRFHPEHVVVGGKSMGGRVASYILNDIPAISGAVFLGYPLHPTGRPDSLRDAHLYTVRCPMLFLSGTRDSFAQRELLEGVIAKLGPRATLIWTEGGDHSLRVGRSGSQSLHDAANAISDWVHKTIVR